MNNRLYVGNLDFSVGDKELLELFSSVGEVKGVQIITDKETDESRGFGFVEMETEEGAKKAIEKFNGEEHMGRELTVEEAKPKPGEEEEESTTYKSTVQEEDFGDLEGYELR